MALQYAMLVVASLLPLTSAGYGMIRNNQIWYDTDGNEIKASLGDHITLIDGVYYWVGADQNYTTNGGDVHIYNSTTLGSDSWTHVTKAIDREPGSGQGSNPRLFKCPTSGKFVLIARSGGGFNFYQSDTVDGQYKNKKKRNYKSKQLGHPDFKVGGSGFYQEGDVAYAITSRRNFSSTERYIAIYKLTPNFLDVESEILWMPASRVEAMWLFKRNNTYYMTASNTNGWTPSYSWYWTAQSLAGPWSSAEKIRIKNVPDNRRYWKRSLWSQHRWIMQVGDQWMYGGDRYPYLEPKSYSMSMGSNVFLPVSFDTNGRPEITWKTNWTILTGLEEEVQEEIQAEEHKEDHILEAEKIPEATSPETTTDSDVSEPADEVAAESEEPIEDSLFSDEEPTEFEEGLDEFGDSELSEQPEDSDDEFGDTDFSEESTPDSDHEFGDSELSEEPTEDSDDDELSEEPTEDLASSDKESDKLEEDAQELPEGSVVPGEEAKELDVPESSEQPKEDLNVVIEHESKPADMVAENKTHDSEVLKVVL